MENHGHQGQHPANTYSTLEEYPQQGYPQQGYPQHEGSQQQGYPQHEGYQQFHQAPEVYYEPSKEAVYQQPPEWAHQQGTPLALDQSEAPEVVSHQGQHHGQYTYAQPVPERRIMGLKRKTFFIVLTIALIAVIGAVVGGAVGGTMASRNSAGSGSSAGGTEPSASEPPPASINSTVLVNSKLSTINWTDASGTEFRGVFWQDRYTNLMMSIWDSTESWEVVNISTSMSDSSVPMKPLNGTPLAATVRSSPYTESPWWYPFTLSLFYISSGNVVQEVTSSDIRGAKWQVGSLTKTSGSGISAATGSSLAAYWHLCPKLCSMNISLIYEDRTQSMRVANSSDWSASPDNMLNNLVMGSPLAITAITPGGGGGPSGPSASGIRIYSDTSGVLQEVMQDNLGKWYYASTLSRALPSSPPQIAALAFSNATTPSSGPSSIITVSAYQNGSLSANFWNNYTWNGDAVPTFQGKGPSDLNFTAISLSSGKDIRMYGITALREVHTWKIDRINPLQWTYEEKINVGTP